MATANEDLLDATLRHQIGLRRVAGGEVKNILSILDRADKDLNKQLKLRLRRGLDNFTTKRMQALLGDIRELRREAFKQMRTKSRDGLLELSKAEQEFQKSLMQVSIPVQLDYAVASASTLAGIVRSQPFAGGANAARTLQQWWDATAVVDQRRITDALQIGLTQNETIDQMVRRVRTATGLTRTNAEAVIRTSVNHVSNASREAFFEANSDVVEVLRWNSTLDGRTSTICAARDGHYILVGEKDPGLRPLLQPQGARPPAHPNCRSIIISVLDPEGVADMMPERPFVRDARTRRMREKDFRAEARANAGKRWSSMDAAARRNAIKDLKRKWAKENIGTVPGDLDYDTWLRRQPVKFQNEVLGKGKAELFRKGTKLDSFVDRQGRELSLKELKANHKEITALEESIPSSPVRKKLSKKKAPTAPPVEKKTTTTRPGKGYVSKKKKKGLTPRGEDARFADIEDDLDVEFPALVPRKPLPMSGNFVDWDKVTPSQRADHFHWQNVNTPEDFIKQIRELSGSKIQVSAVNIDDIAVLNEMGKNLTDHMRRYSHKTWPKIFSVGRRSPIRNAAGQADPLFRSLEVYREPVGWVKYSKDPKRVGLGGMTTFGRGTFHATGTFDHEMGHLVAWFVNEGKSVARKYARKGLLVDGFSNTKVGKSLKEMVNAIGKQHPDGVKFLGSIVSQYSITSADEFCAESWKLFQYLRERNELNLMPREWVSWVEGIEKELTW